MEIKQNKDWNFTSLKSVIQDHGILVKTFLHFYLLSLNNGELNEPKPLFVFKYALFTVLFEQILNDNVRSFFGGKWKTFTWTYSRIDSWRLTAVCVTASWIREWNSSGSNSFTENRTPPQYSKPETIPSVILWSLGHNSAYQLVTWETRLRFVRISSYQFIYLKPETLINFVRCT